MFANQQHVVFMFKSFSLLIPNYLGYFQHTVPTSLFVLQLCSLHLDTLNLPVNYVVDQFFFKTIYAGKAGHVVNYETCKDMIDIK
jgi:hypothetical protein